MLSGASDSILTQKSRPVQVWGQMSELWCLFNVNTVIVKLTNTYKTALMAVLIPFICTESDFF